jgi:predicted Fe-Mo cluster-binding NifX family protein
MILVCMELMKVAIPDWHGRISPVFDVAACLLVADVENGEIVSRRNFSLSTDSFPDRIREVSSLGVDVLICGAVSHPLECGLTQKGVQVISQICGQVEQVLEAFVTDCLDQQMFFMPGCRGQRRRRGGRRPV